MRLAELVGAGRTLDTVLGAAARLIRDATGAEEVTVWQRSNDRFIRRATSAAAAGNPLLASLAPDSVLQATAQRRPVVQPLVIAAGTNRRAGITSNRAVARTVHPTVFA